MNTSQKTALIIGAGPAGLTAAFELLKHTDIKPVVVEALNEIGGIAATYKYKGNRIDLGGHRFYSKDESIRKWWFNVLPLQSGPSIDDLLLGLDRSALFDSSGNDPETTDRVMLIRPRMSRIYFNKNLFDYPLKPSLATFQKLGPTLLSRIAIDYLCNRLRPVRPEKNLEDFFINRFGKKLYETFFKYYTEKVWGISCKEISRDWGSQRVKGVSISELLRHALGKKSAENVQTSLISQFYYPKLGPGQLWDAVAHSIERMGGTILKNASVAGVTVDNSTVREVQVRTKDGIVTFGSDYVFSSMPIKDLVAMITPAVHSDIRTISDRLVYRDFIMTGVLARTMLLGDVTPVFPDVTLLPDTWIYIQEREMLSGRLQNYNNWSPYMVADRSTAWLGLEFFCNEGDDLWCMKDGDLVSLASRELDEMRIVAKKDLLDGTCIRVKKAYPAYWGSYHRLDRVKNYLLSISNLYCIGRNGLHRYNNMDHSMLTAMASVKCIAGSGQTRESVWQINSEDDYGEQK